MLRITVVKDYLAELKKRTLSAYLQKQDIVQKIINEVIQEGDKALFRYAKEFDKIEDPNFSIKVTDKEIEAVDKELPTNIKDILDQAFVNIERYHRKQKEESWNFVHDGAFLGQLVNPIEKVGAYVPGGEGIYPSSVLMNCIPAMIAGVPEIYITTPPRKDGTVDPSIIYAANLCGVKEIFKVGGAGAIAALTYGTETIPRVYKIVGPGNLFVTTAKKMVYGDVDIDMIAGPSEIMVLADEKVNIEYLTYDLFSQSEHDSDASSIVLLPDKQTAEKLIQSVNERAIQSKRKDILTEALTNNGVIVLYDTMEQAYEIINEYAPEHLEILVDIDFTLVANHIKNVGSIFLGEYTPEPIGDYFAGTNHSLPTGGTAKFFSPLGVYDYQKRSGVIRYSKESFKRDQQKVVQLAEYEGFFEHANSARVRK